MRSAPNETALSRLLTVAYEQLDTIKSRYNKLKQKQKKYLFN